MRWDRLFADLEARFDAEQRAGEDSDLSELIRGERAQLALSDRLRAHLGEPLGFSLGTAGSFVHADLLDVGADWVLVRSGREDRVIPMAAVQYVEGLSRSARLEPLQVARRWGLTIVLRGLSRDRAVVAISLRAGDCLTGTIDRVGVDHLDLAMHPQDVPRRAGAVQGLATVAIPAILAVAIR